MIFGEKNNRVTPATPRITGANIGGAFLWVK
jgi:hypothetical protein